MIHVLPVSDDGGSTAEIVRVLGGPAVGDIRSRCLRLADDSNQEVQSCFLLTAERTGGCQPLTAMARMEAGSGVGGGGGVPIGHTPPKGAVIAKPCPAL